MDIQQHPLYDLALERAVQLTPPHLAPNATFNLALVQDLMARMWVQGVTWGVTHPQEAVSSTMWMGERIKAERGDAGA